PCPRPPCSPPFPYTTLFRSPASLQGPASLARDVGLPARAAGLAGRVELAPVAITQGFDRAELGLVAHLAALLDPVAEVQVGQIEDRKSTRLNSSHVKISYAV